MNKRIAAQSHVPISSLTELEAKNRAKKYAKMQRALKQTVRRLRKKLCSLIAKEGETIDEDMSQSLREMMKNNEHEVHKSYPANSFGKLFWEERYKAKAQLSICRFCGCHHHNSMIPQTQ